MKSSSIRTMLAGSVAIACLFAATASFAQERNFNLPAQPANTALPEFARQAGIQIVASGSKLRGVATNGVKGEMDVQAALDAMLSGTGLQVVSQDNAVYVIGLAPRPSFVERISSPRPAARTAATAKRASPSARAVAPIAVAEVKELVVTGTRVARLGFSTPTPTTVIGDTILNSDTGNGIANAIQNFPTFRADFSGAVTGPRSTGTPGAAFANLRSLGSFRTLTLIDGRRQTPTSLIGTVDLNLIPAILVDRIDVVTGGASAAYGSDAVAGVVNIILKRKLQGVIGDVSYGQSAHGDNKDVHVGLGAGTSFAGGRGHAMIAGEYERNDGSGTVYSRDWGRHEYGLLQNPAVTAANPKSPTNPANLHVEDYRLANMAPGGLVVGGPLKGLEFLANGQTKAFQYGRLVGPSFMSGGEGYGGYQYINTLLLNPLKRENLLARLDYDLTDNASVFAEASWARTHSVNRGIVPRDLIPLNIQIDNPYLPASVTAAMRAAGVSSIPVQRNSLDVDFSQNNVKALVTRYAVGAKGDLGDGWTWDAYAQYGRTDYQGEINNARINANWPLAVDAVRNAAGQIVCRVNADADPANDVAGCAPANIFGSGSISAASKAFFMGDEWMTYKYVQKVVAANLRGSPFSTWAGEVSLAAGMEHRSERVRSAADPLSVASGWYIGNQKPLNGAVKVTEGYAEAVTPLLADQAFARKLELDTAVRLTDYSTSGRVATWKVGMNYEVNDQVRFRATRSRDIRAPNIQNLYTPGLTVLQPVVNPATAVSIVAPNTTTGNLGLVPEKADTLTFGVVLTPHLAPGLQVSIDRYDIDLKDAIDALTPQQIVNGCFIGKSELCQYVSLSNGSVARTGGDFASNQITSILRKQINVSQVKSSGWDFEIRYRTPLAKLVGSAPGNLTLQLYATLVQHSIAVDALGVAVDHAGEVGDTVLTGNYSLPRWRGSLIATYDDGPFRTTGMLRYVGGGAYNILWTASDVDDNHVASRTYVDLAAQYDVRRQANGRKVQVYAVVQNLFDKDPPVDPGQVLPTNAIFYDMIGRTFKAGVRFAF